MNIVFYEKQGVFKLDTPNTSYVMGLAGRKLLGHIYYDPSAQHRAKLCAGFGISSVNTGFAAQRSHKFF